MSELGKLNSRHEPPQLELPDSICVDRMAHISTGSYDMVYSWVVPVNPGRVGEVWRRAVEYKLGQSCMVVLIQYVVKREVFGDSVE